MRSGSGVQHGVCAANSTVNSGTAYHHMRHPRIAHAMSARAARTGRSHGPLARAVGTSQWRPLCDELLLAERIQLGGYARRFARTDPAEDGLGLPQQILSFARAACGQGAAAQASQRMRLVP
jgi:hypothetical protein